MKMFFVMMMALVSLSGCQMVVDATVRQTPPHGYYTDAEKWQVQDPVLRLYRNEISRGAHSKTATVQVYGARNYAGGMCFEQRRNGALVYMCTTRRFLDYKSFQELITVRLQPQGAYGLVVPVYIAGPVPSTYRASKPSVSGVIHYQGKFQSKKPRRNKEYRHPRRARY